MPTSIETLARQVAPLHTGQAAADVAARKFNHWPHIDTPTAAGPISDAELTAINEAAKWPYSRQFIGCNGNCSQGRACDCVADVEDVREPMTDSDRMWLGVLLGVSALLSLAVLTWAVDAVRQAAQ